MSQQFKDKCINVAKSMDLDVMFFQDSDDEEPYESFGILYVTQQGLRACFDVACREIELHNHFDTTIMEVLTHLGVSQEISSTQNRSNDD